MGKPLDHFPIVLWKLLTTINQESWLGFPSPRKKIHFIVLPLFLNTLALAEWHIGAPLAPSTGKYVATPSIYPYEWKLNQSRYKTWREPDCPPLLVKETCEWPMLKRLYSLQSGIQGCWKPHGKEIGVDSLHQCRNMSSSRKTDTLCNAQYRIWGGGAGDDTGVLKNTMDKSHAMALHALH